MDNLLNCVQVALPVPVFHSFSYLLPEGTESEADYIGKRVLVPFGKRTLTGVVIDKSSSLTLSDTKFKLKHIIEILDDSPAFSASMLEFTKWMSEYYLAFHGETLKAALPQGLTPQSQIVVETCFIPSDNQLGEMKKRAPKRAALLDELLNHLGRVLTIGYLEKKLQTDSIAVQLDWLKKHDFIKINQFVENDSKPVIKQIANIDSKLLEDENILRSVFDSLDKSAPKQALLLGSIYVHLANDGDAPFVSDVLRETRTNRQALNGLISKNYINLSDKVYNRSAKSNDDEETLSTRDESKLPLTNEQQFCTDEIINAIDKSEYSPFLMHGITGSGKTLVYIHAIKHTINCGKSVLLMVPEISLTPQLIDRFQRIFPKRISVLHSRMSEGERLDSWRSIHSGESKFVIGARSAVFAPLKNLGLIIIDEEHEQSYKQEAPSPRYQGRDSAVMRAKIENCTIVLGSATPSMESMFNAKSGKYKLLEIRRRADGARLPIIKVVNTFEMLKTGQMMGAFSKELFNDIKDRVEKKEGTILFQNRRGYSVLIECADCATIPMCKNCSVSLTLHKRVNQLRCHYCGYVVPAIKSCSVCGGTKMKEVGSGTQRIEEELSDLLKKNNIEARISRMDMDTTRKRGSHRSILTSFAAGETDILVGTQMVAKGLDFERVTLVGALHADLQLFMPDFRASERTFQLITQVSGRSGRSASAPGEVIIQTNHPENSAISNAINNDYDKFYEAETKCRLDALFPPYSRFIYIEFSSKYEDKVIEHSDYFSKKLPKSNNYINVIGPNIPSIERLKGYYRRIIIVKSIKSKDPSGRYYKDILSKAIELYKTEKSTNLVYILVDIDSYSQI
ncbi:MAG: primosomal protein N' [Candidatus Kapabacteria bacterium]|nr:primosomal protein N' [Candidatus Kapabacteria bacterium]